MRRKHEDAIVVKGHKQNTCGRIQKSVHAALANEEKEKRTTERENKK